jgi:hypothetical protein
MANEQFLSMCSALGDKIPTKTLVCGIQDTGALSITECPNLPQLRHISSACPFLQHCVPQTPIDEHGAQVTLSTCEYKAGALPAYVAGVTVGALALVGVVVALVIIPLWRGARQQASATATVDVAVAAALARARGVPQAVLRQ